MVVPTMSINDVCACMHAFVCVYCVLRISPNEVFGDIMVLASRPPVEPDDVNTLTRKNI